ncbi:MAG TPA: MBL fold metallo-hydrolase [Candidatus Dormibacteraeota bacterium]|nr:MBL fold metallo-hydrolase [Candidatus Dormibacteraeota bacterium]
MIFKQFRYEPLGQASYLLACSKTREAAVVDPIADSGADFYTLEAADLGVSITAVMETHVHADFVSCARELADLTGAPHYLHEAAPVRFSFAPLRHGQILTLGTLELQVIHTPGHTPEHVCLLVTDHIRADEPWFVLTGDSLLVGDVGRPDLLIGDHAVDILTEPERVATQYHSIQTRLFTLPEHLEVYPNHYGGSTCGGVNLSGKPGSTIYFEKHHNLAMQQPDAASFAAFVRATIKPLPADYQWIKAQNLGLMPAEISR